MTRYRNSLKHGRIPFTPEEEAARDEEEAAAGAAMPMRDWETEMSSFDKDMPRYMENHIRDEHDGNCKDEFMQAKYNAKIAKRAEKP